MAILTKYGTCPGIRPGENEYQAWDRQLSYYGEQDVHRVFFPETLMGEESGSARSARQIIQEMNPDEDLVVSCKEVGPEFAERVAELRALRWDEEDEESEFGPGRTWLIIHHEPEGDLTVDAYNAKWNTALPTLAAEAPWLWPGTCHTAFWSRRVSSSGVRVNDWRQWIPANPSVQALLRFVSADLYPSAGRPTKAKPNYYEPPGAHPSPYGFGEDIGFCGILDEMVRELRSEGWPNVRRDIVGAIAELNHERPSASAGWPASFVDESGSGCADWLESVLDWAEGRYAWVTYFHKGGGDLMTRVPSVEAEVLRTRIVSTYGRQEPEEPGETAEQAYARGMADGTAVERQRILRLLSDPLQEHAQAVQVLSDTVGDLGNAVEQLDPEG